MCEVKVSIKKVQMVVDGLSHGVEQKPHLAANESVSNKAHF